tara:strand:- start:443 stop:673 length:231 start_codon:yes stop_codon:yes gene_type:complete
MNNKELNMAWLLNEFPQYQVKVMRGDTKNAYLKAEMLLTNAHAIKPRGCGCQNGALKSQVDEQYRQWLLKKNNEEN